jgi:hypothetical protein
MAIVAKYWLNWNANALVWPNGTATNVSWVDWKSNWAGNFNGSSSFIQTSASYTNNQNISTFCFIKTWINPTTQSKILMWVNIQQALFSLYYITEWWQQFLRLANTTDTVYTSSYQVNLADNKWYHITTTKNWTTQQIYLNW